MLQSIWRQLETLRSHISGNSHILNKIKHILKACVKIKLILPPRCLGQLATCGNIWSSLWEMARLHLPWLLKSKALLALSLPELTNYANGRPCLLRACLLSALWCSWRDCISSKAFLRESVRTRSKHEKMFNVTCMNLKGTVPPK